MTQQIFIQNDTMLTDVVQMILGNYAHDVITVLTKNDLRNV